MSNELRRATQEAFHQALQPALEEWMRRIARDKADIVAWQAERCESPIEARMLVALAFNHETENNWIVAPCAETGPDRSLSKDGFFWITPQFEVAGYRLDFHIFAGDWHGGFVRVAVECDGHEFHEKTKEQAARDKARDRAVACAGITVLRFTGAEIWADANKCAAEVYEVVRSKVGEIVGMHTLLPESVAP